MRADDAAQAQRVAGDLIADTAPQSETQIKSAVRPEPQLVSTVDTQLDVIGDSFPLAARPGDFCISETSAQAETPAHQTRRLSLGLDTSNMNERSIHASDPNWQIGSRPAGISSQEKTIMKQRTTRGTGSKRLPQTLALDSHREIHFAPESSTI
ncbi:hypothetical protein PGT21_015209 [Puccinia graminis f. sp. tritici]|uniref:Uncharacterized protein n=1 Tax=Puccinia graminis f. sp. tritici TaxID=56615 RepID=A0A5B0QZJ5_PUCGR|nr:hypothetical protein PGT21_015209 [Puccinia graminis f. sp. tritici]KAA1118620.1 hypothetical protein PGTUg99_003726 [Puccinia graminis f. sp. tritici]